FGNQDFTASTVPPMTSVEPPRLEIGRHIARLLLARIKGDLPETEKRLDLGVRLMARGST
ncbi:substrate-binding domain-containing protein, partial [Halomonas sp. BBD45]